MAPLVSCLMTTYGRWSFVNDALSCFLAQDYPDRELVILNNHPTPLEFNHPLVRIYNEPGYPTQGHCRNRLLELANGEFHRTWDDDDLYLPWTISQGVAHIGGDVIWKPKFSWFRNGKTGPFELVDNVLEASWTSRMDYIRSIGYLHEGGTEHEAIGRASVEITKMRDMGFFASYVYRWGHGAWHISGSIGNGKSTEERTEEWKKNSIDDGGGRPLQPSNLNRVWRELSQACGSQQEEIYNRIIGYIPVDREVDIPREIQLTQILAKYRPELQNPVVVVHTSDDEDAVAQIKSMLPSQRICSEITDWHPQDIEPIDVLILGSDDPMEVISSYRKVEGNLKQDSLIIVEGYRDRSKPILMQPILEPTHQFDVIGDCMVFTSR